MDINDIVASLADQPERIRKAALIAAVGRVQIWPNEHPLMAAFREWDIQNLEANVRAARG